MLPNRLGPEAWWQFFLKIHSNILQTSLCDCISCLWPNFCSAHMLKMFELEICLVNLSFVEVYFYNRLQKTIIVGHTTKPKIIPFWKNKSSYYSLDKIWTLNHYNFFTIMKNWNKVCVFCLWNLKYSFIFVKLIK